MSECEATLLALLHDYGTAVYAWCILPNHYHLLVRTDRIKELRAEIGRFHGRASFKWNSEDQRRGRKVWYNCLEREIRSGRHFWATVNYIHHNPVRHEYVDQWQDWPWSSAAEFLERIGNERALRIWLGYPVLDYGKKWDVD
jgi:putative transposase